MPTNAQVADALRALAEIYETQHDTAGLACQWRSTGRAPRIAAGMDHVMVESHTGESGTNYLIWRGQLLGMAVEVMESQDD
jgi:hypothetical protein